MATTGRIVGVVLGGLALTLAAGVSASETTYRLYDGITAFVANPDGRPFTVTLDVRDLNHRMHGPSELLVKVYPPDGKPVIREAVPDDGIVAPAAHPVFAGWDHEAWYYATCYSRGLQPLARWSGFSDPKRLAALAKRSFTYEVAGGQSGVYRVVIVGTPDHYVTVKLDSELKYAVAGSPEWLHGHTDLFRRSYIYVPKTTHSINLLFLQLDEPASRTFVLADSQGNELASGNGTDGLVQTSVLCEGRYNDQVLTLDVSDGPGDFLINVTHQLAGSFRPFRAAHLAVTALLSPDVATAKATCGGAIYHDDDVFWQTYQVRLHDWLKRLDQRDFEYPAEAVSSEGFISVGSHNSPPKGSADRIMHGWARQKNPQALNAAIKEMLFGMRLIGHGDHVAIGPKRNLAYEQGCYTFFWYRPAWRILQQTDAPPEIKEAIREFIIQAGDRLAFCRTMAMGNGNALASLMAGLRYCCEASGDPLQQELFETLWERFTSGGFGDRFGIGPSGGLQESLGYDFHYGSYVLRGWKAVIADLKDPRFIKARNRMFNLYSYIWSPGPAMPWSSRTSIPKLAGGTYDSWDSQYRWKGYGGPDFVEGANGHSEWFAARRPNYYVVTYHGRLTPTWEGEGFHGQIGLGGGGICQLHVPDHGQVITAKPNDSYGSGMHLSQWQNFHIHSLVGVTADGLPLVAANSEHFDAALDGSTVTSSGPVRQSSVSAMRRYTFERGAIDCEVHLCESHHDNVFSIWGGRPRLRGKVVEAYEMIPFADVLKRKGRPRPTKGRTRVEGLTASNESLGALTEEKVEAAGVLVDRGGYGMLVELDMPRFVKRGDNDTILIQLVDRLTPASEVGICYRLAPFAGDPPKLGETPTVAAKTYPLARLEGVDSPECLSSALEGQQTLEIHDKSGAKIAELRFALRDDKLAISAEIRDRKVIQHATVWRGSCLEIFGCMPDSEEIGQVLLVPRTGDSPAAAYRAEGSKQIKTSDVHVSSAEREGGYEVRALIPLALLKLSPEKNQLLLEFQVSSERGSQRTHHTLFGSRRAYENNVRYGLFEVR